MILFILPSSVFSQDVSEIGFIKFNFNTDSALVIVDYDFTSDTTIANGDSLKLSVGKHRIELNVPLSPKITRELIVYKDITTILNITFSDPSRTIESLAQNYASRKFLGVNMMVLTDSDSDIYFNGELLGTAYGESNLSFGNHKVEIINPDFGRKEFSINGLPFLEIYEFHLRPDKQKSKILSFIPGASQFYKKQYFKSAILGSLFPVSVLISVFSGIEYQDEKELFQTYKLNYSLAKTQSNAILFGDLTEKQQKITQDAKNKYQVILIATSLIYIVNVADGFLNTPKGGYRSKQPLEFYLSNKSVSGLNYNTATVRLNFGK